MEVSKSAARRKQPPPYGGLGPPPLDIRLYLCPDCGYMEQWVDPKQFQSAGGRAYWEAYAAREKELEEMESYWQEQLRRQADEK